MMNYPVIKIAIAFITGILLNQIIPFNFTLQLFLFFTLVIVIFVFIMIKKRLNTPFITLFLYLLIIQCGSFSAELQNKKAYFIPDKFIKEDNFTIYGRIEDINLIREKEVSYTVNVDSFLINKELFSLQVNVLAKFRNNDTVLLKQFYSSIYPGYYLKQQGRYMKGRETRNPGEFDYNKYLRSQGISGILTSNYEDEISVLNYEPDKFKSYIFEIRKAIDYQITSLHEEKTAALLRGLILADRSGIDYDVKEEFLNSGVMHILAVSGLHTGYIALIFLLLFGRFNLTLRTVLTAAGLISFLLISGIPVSVFRAVTMAVVFLFALLSGRTSNIFNSLSLAAIIILIADPYEIYNPGFQLSFSAVISIGFIYPFMRDKINVRFTKIPFVKYILLFIAASLAAQAGTLPLTIFYFGKLSVIALAANLVIIPLIGFIIGTAVVTLMFSFMAPFISIYYAAANDLLSNILFTTIHYAGTWKYSFIGINHLSAYGVIIFYLLLVILFFAVLKIELFRRKIVFAVIIILNIITLTSLDNQKLMPNGLFSFLMIDVGQGDSFLMKFPDGITFLIDAGEVNKYFDTGERVIMPLLNHLDIDKVDYAFISHLDIDHYGGMISMVNSGRIKHLYIPPVNFTSTGQRLEKYLREKSQSFSYYHNEVFTFGNVKLYSLYNEDAVSSLSSNENSGLLKVVYGNNSFLFTGDVYKSGESYYINKYGSFLKSDVLKVAHHGSNSSSSQEFINFVDQDFALISAGYKNRFKHPAPEVIERLNLQGTKILRTDLNGAVLLYCDGNKVYEIDWKNN
jgi:competence protein ComEC